MPGSVSNPVRLDHFQNIVEVGWPSRKKYIITTARFAIDLSVCTTEEESGNDGIPYGLPPAGQSGLWTTAVGFGYWTGSPSRKYDSFDVYDAAGQYVETLTVAEISASLPVVPVTTTFPRFEVFITVGDSRANLDWGSVGAVADPLFPDHKTGSAILQFANGYDYSGAENKYWAGSGDPNIWHKFRAITATPTPKALSDVTPTSLSYLGHAYLPIGVNLTEGSGLGQDYIQSSVLFQRQN